ncbi:hypothetical protein [Rufibacter immobilis]|uniref:hypothetical protein n=1 Tax=Rufibacter immobilis TaxID=1348778 RepID=UPI0035E8B583
MNPINLTLVVLFVISAFVTGIWLSSILKIQFFPKFADISNIFDLIFDAEEKSEKIKYIILLSTYLLSPVIVAVAFFTGFEPAGEYSCRQYKYFLDYSVQGILKKKFIDRENHSFKTLVLLNGKGEVIDREIDFYFPAVYDLIEKGDTVIKAAKSNEMTVKKKGKVQRFASRNLCTEE